MAVTTLHNYPTPQHLVQALYVLRAVDGAFGALRCIRFQFSVSEFPRRALLSNRVNRGTLHLQGASLGIRCVEHPKPLRGRRWFGASLPIGVARTQQLGPVVRVRRLNMRLLVFNRFLLVSLFEEATIRFRSKR